MDISLNKPLLLAVAVSALTACSGGGSSSGSNGNTDNPASAAPSTKSLSGEAVKGVLASAVVTAKNLDGTVTYGTTQTDTDGTYTLAGLDLGTGPVLVELTTDSDTEMTCDSATGCTRNGTTTAFGSTFSFNDPSFMLTAILPGTATTDSSARLMVTPVTHMAAQRAIASGATTTEEIEGINRATAKLLGLDNVDITSIAPSDITSTDSSTDDSAARKYGALVAAFSTLAEASGGDISATIDAISDDFATDGSMKANTSTDGELALADIFAAAEDSAQAAEDAGVDLGETGADLALETAEAESAEPDSEVTPDEEDTTPADQLTESEAIEQGIALLEDMNNWYQALTSVDVETKGDMYEEHLTAAYDLLPAFDDTTDALQAWRALVIDKETNCTYEWEGVCYDYETRTTAGPLFDSIGLAGMLVFYAEYLETNHGMTPATDNEDGSFTISTTDLGDDLYDLDIFQALETEEGSLAAGAEIIATYTWGPDDKITDISFYGTGADMILASEANPVSLTYTHTDDVIQYLLTDMVAIKREGSDSTIDTLEGDLSVTFTFTSVADAEAYLIARESDDVIDPGTFASIDIALNGSVSAGTQAADVDFTATLNADSPSSREVAISLAVASDADDDSNAEINGVFTLTGTADYTQSGNASEGFDVELTNIAGTLGFEGSLTAALDNGSTLDFMGSVSMSADDGSTVNDESGIESQLIELEGTATLVDATRPEATTTSFDGNAAIGYRAIKTPEGERLIINDNHVMFLEGVVLNGDLSTGNDNDGTATLSVTGVLSIDNLNSFTVAEPSLPEEGTPFSINGSVTKVNDDTATFTFDTPIIDQLTTATGISYDDYYVSNDLPITVTRVFYPANPDTFEDAYYALNVEFSYYLFENYWLEGYSTYDIEGPIATDDIREIAKAVMEQNTWVWITAYSDAIETSAGSIWNQPTTFSENYEFSIPAEIRGVYVDVDSLIDEAETEDNYRNVSIALSINAEATGLDDAEIRVIATRTGEEDFVGSVQLSYNSTDMSTVRSLSLELDSSAAAADGDNNYLTIKNADSEMIITATCIDAQDDPDACTEADLEFAGKIFVGEYQAGTLESRNGVPVFMFGNDDKYRILTPNFLVEKIVE